jgi:hypothetical protein
MRYGSRPMGYAHGAARASMSAAPEPCAQKQAKIGIEVRSKERFGSANYEFLLSMAA